MRFEFEARMSQPKVDTDSDGIDHVKIGFLSEGMKVFGYPDREDAYALHKALKAFTRGPVRVVVENDQRELPLVTSDQMTLGSQPEVDPFDDDALLMSAEEMAEVRGAAVTVYEDSEDPCCAAQTVDRDDGSYVADELVGDGEIPESAVLRKVVALEGYDGTVYQIMAELDAAQEREEIELGLMRGLLVDVGGTQGVTRGKNRPTAMVMTGETMRVRLADAEEADAEPLPVEGESADEPGDDGPPDGGDEANA